MDDDIDFSKSKMYLLVKSSVDSGHSILSVGHGALGGYLTFIENERLKDFSPGELCPECGKPWDQLMTQTDRWVKESFRKCVCAVTDEEFEKAKTFGVAGVDFRVMTESGLGGIEVAIVFAPKVEWPPFFKSLSLWGKKIFSKEGILACPFCGKFPSVVKNSCTVDSNTISIWSIECCIADTGACLNSKAAIETWNKRIQ